MRKFISLSGASSACLRVAAHFCRRTQRRPGLTETRGDAYEQMAPGMTCTPMSQRQPLNGSTTSYIVASEQLCVEVTRQAAFKVLRVLEGQSQQKRYHDPNRHGELEACEQLGNPPAAIKTSSGCEMKQRRARGPATRRPRIAGGEISLV